MDNPEKLTTLGTQDTRQKTNKTKKQNTICVGHHYKQDTRQRQTKQRNKTQYVLDTTMRKI